jgi:dipeptidyl aminopeptidase/acylaminoacyl peptidase
MPRTIRTSVLVLLLGALPAFAQRAPYTPEQLSLIRHVSECQMAPDGKTVAFVTDLTGALELWTVPAAGGWPNQLTNLNEQVSDIRWSPDGKWIVFTSDYGGNERRDLYRVKSTGGAVEKLTDTRLSETGPRFSPDGKRLAFTADPDRDFLFQLFVMDLETKKAVQLTRESVNVQKPVWSPDGTTIAVTRSGDEQKGELLLIDATTGAKVEVAPPVKDGILWPEAFKPDGKALLLTGRNKAGFMQLTLLELTPSAELGKAPKPSGEPRFFGPDQFDVIDAQWHSRGIFYLQNLRGIVVLKHLPSTQEFVESRELLERRGVISQVSLDATGDHLAVLRETVTQSADVWVYQTNQRSTPDLPDIVERQRWEKQITFSLMGGVKPEELSKGEMITYESFDKTPIETLFLKPKVNRLGSPPPAVVYVHGGPNGQIRMEFNPFFHVLTEAGFAVIAPNYRGSTGYGKAFEDLNNKDWGGGDLKDLVAAVQFFAKRGDIDPKRVGITGGSYGGYMTLLALCKTPDVWKAGVERYGMPDLVMDYMICKSRFADWYETEMGNPKKDAALFRERSPLPYLDEIKAPLLIFQGANDTNVPKTESDLLVAVLKELKKPHEYVVYDDEGHGFTRRKNLLDCYRRTAEFFVKQLGEKK